MDITILYPDKLKGTSVPSMFKYFAQHMVNHLCVGYYRYGPPDKAKKYMTRMEIEVKEYRRTGNAEHLYNIANYASLEYYAPENKNFHLDNTVGSATRGKI